MRRGRGVRGGGHDGRGATGVRAASGGEQQGDAGPDGQPDADPAANTAAESRSARRRPSGLAVWSTRAAETALWSRLARCA